MAAPDLNQNPTQRFPLRLNDALYDRLRARAFESGMAMHDLVVQAVVNELKRPAPPRGPRRP